MGESVDQYSAHHEEPFMKSLEEALAQPRGGGPCTARVEDVLAQPLGLGPVREEIRIRMCGLCRLSTGSTSRSTPRSRMSEYWILYIQYTGSSIYLYVLCCINISSARTASTRLQSHRLRLLLRTGETVRAPYPGRHGGGAAKWYTCPVFRRKRPLRSEALLP